MNNIWILERLFIKKYFLKTFLFTLLFIKFFYSLHVWWKLIFSLSYFYSESLNFLWTFPILIILRSIARYFFKILHLYFYFSVAIFSIWRTQIYIFEFLYSYFVIIYPWNPFILYNPLPILKNLIQTIFNILEFLQRLISATSYFTLIINSYLLYRVIRIISEHWLPWWISPDLEL